MSMEINGMGGIAMPQGMTAASGSYRASPHHKMSNLFSAIDADNSGSISKDELTKAFETLKPPAAFKQAGVDAVWSQLDPNNTGSVSRQQFVDTMKQLMVDLRQRNGQQATASPADTAAGGTDGMRSFYI